MEIPNVWSTRTGKRYKISAMKTYHIKQALNMLLTIAEPSFRRTIYIEVFKKELLKRTLKERLNDNNE